MLLQRRQWNRRRRAVWRATHPPHSSSSLFRRRSGGRGWRRRGATTPHACRRGKGKKCRGVGKGGGGGGRTHWRGWGRRRWGHRKQLTIGRMRKGTRVPGTRVDPAGRPVGRGRWMAIPRPRPPPVRPTCRLRRWGRTSGRGRRWGLPPLLTRNASNGRRARTPQRTRPWRRRRVLKRGGGRRGCPSSATPPWGASHRDGRPKGRRGGMRGVERRGRCRYPLGGVPHPRLCGGHTDPAGLARRTPLLLLESSLSTRVTRVRPNGGGGGEGSASRVPHRTGGGGRRWIPMTPTARTLSAHRRRRWWRRRIKRAAGGRLDRIREVPPFASSQEKGTLPLPSSLRPPFIRLGVVRGRLRTARHKAIVRFGE